MRVINTAALWGCLLGFGLASAAGAQSEAESEADREIGHLLGFVEASPCRFVRNGTVHAPAEGRAHLERKRKVLDRRGMIESAEDFIRLAATGSSITGRPYSVRCPEREPVASADWLGAELKRWRAAHPSPD
ncbi:MAG: DUF5329 domain-containing protein [Myxococcota bacterium]